MIFLLAGLVIDGARQLGARSRAIGYAQEAARAGAAGIELNADVVRIDTEDAADRLETFCQLVRDNDPAVKVCRAVELDAEHLVVAVELKNKTTFLSMIGTTELTAKGRGEAHAEQGINKADETPTIPSISLIPTDLPPKHPPSNTAQPPTIEIPCPTWPEGSPKPTITFPFPMPLPTTCTPTPSATPTPTPTAT